MHNILSRHHLPSIVTKFVNNTRCQIIKVYISSTVVIAATEPCEGPSNRNSEARIYKSCITSKLSWMALVEGAVARTTMRAVMRYIFCNVLLIYVYVWFDVR